MANSEFAPAYIALWQSGELEKRVASAYRILENCEICPRQCHVNRRESAKGAACRTGERAVVCSYGPHYGEEAPLVGRRGSGTIFFAWCNLRCQFCQNFEISQLGEGRKVEPKELAAMMLRLQDMGCHNVNLVSPTHVTPQILAALLIAAEGGLRIPLVYNTGGYDALPTLRLLDGVVDIYMPDMKYADAEIGWRFSGVKEYPLANQAAVKEMHRQVGDLLLDERGCTPSGGCTGGVCPPPSGGIALRGLLIRHLVLPNGLAGTPQIARFLAEEISRHTYLNIMAQYRPCYRAADLPDMERRITAQEYQEAVEAALRLGLERLDERPQRGRWLYP